MKAVRRFCREHHSDGFLEGPNASGVFTASRVACQLNLPHDTGPDTIELPDSHVAFAAHALRGFCPDDSAVVFLTTVALTTGDGTPACTS